MTSWQVNLLGVPHAEFQGIRAHLRSKETWAVLASLVLPTPLTTRSIPGAVLRSVLAERFWAESRDARDNLRKSVQSLRKAFPDCILADRNTLQAVPRTFVTDVEQMLTAYEKATLCSAPEERLYWLTEAEEHIGGEFLEGCITEADQAYNWWLGRRKDVHGKIVMVLLALAETLEEAKNLNAAHDIVRKALQFQSDHAEVRRELWRLAVATGQGSVVHSLEATEDLEEAMVRLDHKPSSSLTLNDRRAFSLLVEDELQKLSDDASKSFRHLCIFPAPFSAKLAKQICDISPPLLSDLAKTPLLHRYGKSYQIQEVVRQCAWRKLPTTTQRQLTKRLALFYVKKVCAMVPPENALPPVHSPLKQERPFLLLTLEWVLEQGPEARYLWFIKLLRFHGFFDLAQRSLLYLQKFYEDPTQTGEVRLQAAIDACYILMQVGNYQEAISPLEMVLPFAGSVSMEINGQNSKVHWLATLYATLMMNYSNIDEWEKAKVYGQEALKFYRMESLDEGAVHCLRYLAEIHHHRGEFEQALVLCEQALVLRRAKQFSDNDIPDALYWMARILYGLKRFREAADAVEEALSLWQKAGDIKIGLCVCLMGQVHAAQGRFAEARAHVHHALLLHKGAGSEVHRIAAVETLGDILLSTGNAPEAQERYQECLRYYETHSHFQRAQRVQEKLFHSKNQPYL